MSLAKNSGYSLVFLANFSQWQEVGYFDTDASLKPLLHLWSLGVEEQFYIVWPVMVLMMPRARWRLFIYIIIFITLASFFASLYSGFLRYNWGFYLPFSRFWELATGGLLAIFETHYGIKSSKSLYRSFAGLLIAGICLYAINERQSYPGYLAVGPVLSSLLLISSPRSLINARFLSTRVMSSLGKISYPLYLWHWPLLAFMHQKTVEPLSTTQLLTWFFIVLLLTTATYVLLEKPIRFRLARSFRWQVPSALILINCLIISFATLIVADNGIPSRLPPFEREFEMHPYIFGGEQRFKTCFLDEGSPPDNFPAQCWGGNRGSQTAKPVVLLWGDSNAAALYPGLLALSKKEDFEVTQFDMGRCPPLAKYRSDQWPTCHQENNFVLNQISSHRPDVVIISALWMLYYEKGYYKQEDGVTLLWGA